MLVFCISSLKSLKIRPLSISYSYRTKEKTAFHERLNWFSYTYSVKDFSEKFTSGVRHMLVFCISSLKSLKIRPKFRLNQGCFVCFLASRPKSTAMDMVGRSVHLATLFPGQT